MTFNSSQRYEHIQTSFGLQFYCNAYDDSHNIDVTNESMVIGGDYFIFFLNSLYNDRMVLFIVLLHIPNEKKILSQHTQYKSNIKITIKQIVYIER